MFFSFGPNGIQHRFMDLSYQAVESNYFPVSVGLRSQAMKLKFVSPDIEGRFLKPTFPLDRVMEIFDGRFTALLPKPILHQSHVGESLSLIYSPFYVEEKLYDGILNRPVCEKLPEEFDASRFPGGHPNRSIGFIPTLCHNCGWDLEGHRDSLILTCKNCSSMWRGAKNGLKQIPYAHIPAMEDGAVFLPFWRIKADVSGIHLVSYADLVKVANLPKAPQKAWDNIGFRFWAPAFKLRPPTFLRLASNLTLAQPRDAIKKAIPEGRLYPVNLPVKEAIESLKINLTGFMKPQKRLLSMIEKIRIRAVRYILVYIPFIEKHHDLVYPKCQLSINKNQLRLSGNL